ncbi:hypothetical protein GGR52DRAFT_573751 [Hypoxylon sp. FL1284]|nr:hypothetical protein GGR52DRAFT_573751 [Hypoxylon sp. FL1284]
MVSYRMIAVAGFLASVSALPLNINLGAYSPALVVGDGEISFGGGEDVSNLMNALEGAAVDAATGTTNGAAEPQSGAAVPAASTPAAAAATPAETVATETVANEPATPVNTAPAETEANKVDPNLEEQAQQISGLQGMGKQIAPRESETPKAKRDLAGFDRALNYAEAALSKGPTVQLGTGEGGAGVGIIVDNNGRAVGDGAAAEGAAARRAKRDETSQPRRRTKVTRMYVKRGVPDAVQASNEFETRSVNSLPVANVPAATKRDSVSPDVIDSINLNVDGEQGFTMTFVETTDDDGAAEGDDAAETDAAEDEPAK